MVGRSMQAKYEFSARAQRALRSIAVTSEDEMHRIDFRRIKALRNIGPDTVLEIRKARTRYMQEKHGPQYTDRDTVPIIDQESFSSLVAELKLSARSERALEILGVDTRRKLVDLDLAVARDTPGIGWGVIRDIRSVRDAMLEAKLDKSRVYVDRFGEDSEGRTPVEYSGELLWVPNSSLRTTAAGRLTAPFKEILNARHSLSRHRENVEAQRRMETETPFDPVKFAREHRLSKRAMRALDALGIRSDQALRELSLRDVAEVKTAGAKTVTEIQRAKARIILRPAEVKERAQRTSSARILVERLDLPPKSIEILAQAGVRTQNDLLTIDLTGYLELFEGRRSKQLKEAVEAIRGIQKEMLRTKSGSAPAEEQFLNPEALALAQRHGLAWRAAHAFTELGMASDEDLMAVDFSSLGNIDNVGEATLSRIRKARTALMKSVHGEAYWDEGMREPEIETPAKAHTELSDLDLSQRTQDALKEFGIEDTEGFLHMDLMAFHRQKGVGRKTYVEARDAIEHLARSRAGQGCRIGTVLRTSRSGKGILVRFDDEEDLWLPKGRCKPAAGDMISAPASLISACRDWLNKKQQEAEKAREDDLSI